MRKSALRSATHLNTCWIVSEDEPSSRPFFTCSQQQHWVMPQDWVGQAVMSKSQPPQALQTVKQWSSIEVVVSAPGGQMFTARTRSSVMLMTTNTAF
jgi:hypothetical protein